MNYKAHNEILTKGITFACTFFLLLFSITLRKHKLIQMKQLLWHYDVIHSFHYARVDEIK